MKLLFITFIDILNSLPQRSHHLINFLRGKYDITVVFCRYDDTDIINKTENGIRYIGIPVKFYSLFSPLTLFKSLSKIDGKYYEICIAQGPWAGIAAVELLKNGKIDFLAYEDIDYFPAFFEYEEVYNRTAQMEKYCIQNADVTFSVNCYLADLREKQTGIIPYYIPNGVNYKIFQREKIKHDGICLMYSGSLEHWAGLELPIKSLPSIRRELGNVYIIILGKGKYADKLKKLVSDLNLDDYVKFYGKVRYEELPFYFSMADVGLCTLFPTELIKYSFPLKAIEYMAAGLPVIATDIGDLGDLIKKHECGITIEYSKVVFEEKIIELLQDNKKLNRLSINGIEASKTYDWNDIFKKELKIINKKLQNKTKLN